MDKYMFEIFREGLHKDSFYRYDKMKKEGFSSKKEAFDTALETIKKEGSYSYFTWYIAIINERDVNKEEGFIRYEKDSIYVLKNEDISKLD